MKRILALVASSCAVLFLATGCVVGRRTIDLPVAALSAPTAPAKGEARIAAITDDRKFENQPSDPSTPSIDGDVTTMSTELKATMIGRQRNTYGHAMGDIALPAGDSVEKRVRLLIEQGLQRRGYQISTSESAPTSVDVSIDKFWAWTTPGMWALTFEARVYCNLTLHQGGQSKTLSVQGSSLTHGQVAKNGNWQEAYAEAFADFSKKLEAALASAGF